MLTCTGRMYGSWHISLGAFCPEVNTDLVPLGLLCVSALLCLPARHVKLPPCYRCHGLTCVYLVSYSLLKDGWMLWMQERLSSARRAMEASCHL